MMYNIVDSVFEEHNKDNVILFDFLKIFIDF